nr:response regulator [Deinococcus apachensis]
MIPRILLVEDNPDITRVVQYELEQAGYQVLTAPDGVTGLTSAREHSPDLVILDLGPAPLSIVDEGPEGGLTINDATVTANPSPCVGWLPFQGRTAPTSMGSGRPELQATRPLRRKRKCWQLTEGGG